MEIDNLPPGGGIHAKYVVISLNPVFFGVGLVDSLLQGDFLLKSFS